MEKKENRKSVSNETVPVGNEKEVITKFEKDKYTLDDDCKVKDLLPLFV